MAADQNPLEVKQPPPAGMGTVAIKGGKTVAKPNRAAITNDAEFMTAIAELDATVDCVLEVVKCRVPLELEKIRDFLNFSKMGKIKFFIKGKSAFESLSIIAGMINGLFASLINIKPPIYQGEKGIIEYYKKSGEEAVFAYLQVLTKKMLEKMHSYRVNFFTDTNGIRTLSTDKGV